MGEGMFDGLVFMVGCMIAVAVIVGVAIGAALVLVLS